MSKPTKIAVVEPYFKSMGEHSYTRPDYATSFRVNYQWLKFGDENKKLAINKFSVFPVNYYFTTGVTVNYKDKLYEVESLVMLDKNNNMDDVLDCAFDDLNEQLHDEIQKDHEDFDDTKLLKFWFANGTFSVRAKYDTVFWFKPNALKVLNQKDVSETKWFEMTGSINKVELFHGVWDRERLFLHASFSSAYKHYVCEMNESFIFLNKEFVCDSHLFDIWFSVDGEHPFPLYHENYLFELAFMHGKQKFNKH